MGFKGWNIKSTNKFGAKKTEYKGMVFDSKVEMQRFMYLEFMQKEGKISNLRTQRKFQIIRKVVKVVAEQLKTKVRYKQVVVEMASHYTADFVYIENGRYVVEDVKNDYSQDIRDYPLRRKLMVIKIQDHNEKGHGQWFFRESVYKNGRLKIKDIEP